MDHYDSVQKPDENPKTTRSSWKLVEEVMQEPPLEQTESFNDEAVNTPLGQGHMILHVS